MPTISTRPLAIDFRVSSASTPPTNPPSGSTPANDFSITPSTTSNKSRSLKLHHSLQLSGVNHTPARSANSASVDAARNRFSARPTVQSVVTGLLSEALSAATHRTDLDIAQLVLAEPDPDAPDRRKYTRLVDIALDHLLKGTALNFSGDRKLLETRPSSSQDAASPNDTLPLDLRSLEHLIRDLPNLFKAAFKRDLVHYWNGAAYPALVPGSHSDLPPLSRRQWLSAILRNNLHAAGAKAPALDNLQRKTLNQVVNHPEKSSRPQPEGDTGASVFTLNLGLEHDPESWAAYSNDLLIVRTINDREVVLLYKSTGEIQPYDSVAAFKSAWAQQLEEQLPLDQLKFGLEEPEGSIFDTQADNLLHKNLRTITLLPTPLGGQANADLAQQFAEASDPFLDLPTAPNGQRQLLEALHKAPPEWLRDASEADLAAYRNLALQLTRSVNRNGGRSYKHGIPDIQRFAQQQLDAKLPKGYATKDLSVVFNVPVGTLGGGYIERVPMSLEAMALQNLAGLPKGEMEVYHNGKRVPELEKDGLLKTLVQQVDIGKHYPARIEHTLSGDSEDTRERRALFAERLTIELPLQALSQSLQKGGGFSALGYRYVEALVHPGPGQKHVDNQEIVLRPLAFLHRPGAQPDVVDNMFLIEPKDPAAGPHILYRPLLSDAPLLEFPTRAALMEAIATPGDLQKSVLAWLPNQNTRDVYTHNGFREPHLQRFNQGDEFARYEAAKPATLATDNYGAADSLLHALQAGKLMDALYDANARGLLSLADQQSVSDSESRWATLKEGGFLVLNAVLPALRTPGMVMGTLMQFDAIQQDLETLDGENGADKSGAVLDLLLNMMFAIEHLTSRPSATHNDGNGNPAAESSANSVDAEPPAHASDAATRPLPADINQALKFPQLNPRTRLVDLINSFEVPQPGPLASPIAEGRLKGLYRVDGKLYAKAHEKWYRVGADLDQVFLLDGENKARTGPFLTRSNDGSWQFKEVASLRGGTKSFAADEQMTARFDLMSASITAQGEALNHSKLQLNTAWKAYTVERQQLLEKWHAMDTAQPDSAARLEYQKQLVQSNKAQTELYDGINDYRAKLSEYHTLSQSAIDVLTPKSRTQQSSFFQQQRSELFLKMFEAHSALEAIYEPLALQGSYTSDGKPLVKIVEGIHNRQPGAYHELTSAQRANFAAKEQLLGYYNQRTALLNEWANNSPIGKEQAKHMGKKLAVQSALKAQFEASTAKIIQAKEQFRQAESALASNPADSQLEADRDAARFNVAHIEAQRDVMKFNGLLAINKAEMGIVAGNETALTRLDQVRKELAEKRVEVELKQNLMGLLHTVSDAKRALESSPNDSTRAAELRTAEKYKEEVKRRLTTPGVVAALAKEPKSLIPNMDILPLTGISPALSLTLNTLSTLKELSLDRSAPSTPEEAEIRSRITNTQVDPLLKRHRALLSPNDYSVEQRKSELTELASAYQILLNDRRQLKQKNSAFIHPDYNDLLIERFDGLLKNLEGLQASLDQEIHDDSVPPLPTPGKPHDRLSPPKIKKTRPSKGSPTGEAPDVGNTQDPVADRVSFRAGPSSPLPSLTTLKTKGQALIDRFKEQERLVLHQKKKLNQPAELENIQPLDWEKMLGDAASHLLELADRTEQAQGQNAEIAALINEWRTQAERMQATMYGHVRDAYVLQSPTAEKVNYLVKRGLATIEPNPKVLNTRDGKVFTEYSVRDTRQQRPVLWYAHFHYDSAAAAKAHPGITNSAHLKLPNQRKLTQNDLNRMAGKNRQAEAIVRARIKPPLDEIFLRTRP